jgi:DNA-binding CsgD family transcriptional regulator
VSEGCTPDETQLARALAIEYVNGGYRDDPNVCSRNVARAPAVYCMRADELLDARYRRHFYEEPRISYELVHLVSVDGVLYYLSFYRDERTGPFYANDVIAMRRLGQFAVPALQRHVDLLQTPESLAHAANEPAPIRRNLDHVAMLEHMRQVFLETPNHLSPREAEVCASIVLGYSTIAISLNLKIALNTVATHRKRAYKKLEICSQSELFVRYFEIVKRLQDSA